MSIMKYCSDSNIRQHFYEVRNGFATEEQRNNKKVILDILQERNKKSELLGYQNYAELSLHFKMANSPQEITTLFVDISQKARVKAQKEIEEIQEFFNLEKLSAWDLGYYARKLREQKYALDDKELKKYFEFDRVLKGMFDIIHRLYGLDIKKIDQKTYHDEVEIYEVSRNGKFLSYYFTDFFYRPLKRQ